MPKLQLPWDLDFKPEKGDVTGANVVKKGLKKFTKASWIDRRTGRRISRKKIPQTICDFARLNQAEQSQILSVIYGDLPLMYNLTADQYGKQFQRYMRKLYKQQFELMPAKMQMDFGKPRDFDLMHGPLYSKARSALDRKMKKATKIGIKSSRGKFYSLEPSDVRTIYVKSDENNPRHVQENANFICAAKA